MKIDRIETRGRIPLMIGLSASCAAVLLAGCMSSPTYGTGKTANQQLMEDVTGILALGPQDKPDIRYTPRGELVRPPTTTVLPEPQQEVASAENPAWPESPEERRRRIEEGQANAEKIKQQLAEAEKNYAEILKKANAEAAALIEETRKSAEALSQREAQNAIRQAEDIIAKARADIENERNRMVDEVKKEMVGLVVNTTAKVTGKVLTPEDQKRLNEETAAQLAV